VAPSKCNGGKYSPVPSRAMPHFPVPHFPVAITPEEITNKLFDGAQGTVSTCSVVFLNQRRHVFIIEINFKERYLR